MLYRINGMEDHLHILTEISPSIALSDFVRDIKTSTSVWLKGQEHFTYFRGWADGYCALTYSFKEKDVIINYIKEQEEHHKAYSFKEEYRQLLKENHIEIDERFFLK